MSQCYTQVIFSNFFQYCMVLCLSGLYIAIRVRWRGYEHSYIYSGVGQGMKKTECSPGMVENPKTLWQKKNFFVVCISSKIYIRLDIISN